jgi:hypothetical protein
MVPDTAISDDLDAETPDSVLRSVADTIIDLLDRREVLGRIIRELEQEHFQGHSIQDDLNEIFSRSEDLRIVSRLDYADELAPLLDDLEEDYLDSEQRQEFEAWWGDVDWIAPGIAAYRREKDSLYSHWTRKNVDIDSLNGEIVANWTLWYGVDQQYSVRVPFDAFFEESVQRITLLVNVLPIAIERNDVSPELFAKLYERRELLDKALTRLDAIADAHGLEIPTELESEDRPRFDPSTGNFIAEGGENSSSGESEADEERGLKMFY